MAIARVRSVSSAPVSRMRSIHSFAVGRRLRIHQKSSRRHTASATVSTSPIMMRCRKPARTLSRSASSRSTAACWVDPRSSGSTSMARPT